MPLESMKYYAYAEPEPSCGISSHVQKGLIPSLECGGTDLCEEGMGFGVPMLQYARDFYFPGTASVSTPGRVSGIHVTKQFNFDLIERFQDSASRIQHFSWVQSRVNLDIFKVPIGRKILKFINSRILKYSIKMPPPRFIRVPSRGKARVDYAIERNMKSIHVRIELESIYQKNCQRIYISNELGGKAFTLYRDGSGLQLQGDSIGEWNKIEAHWALFYSPSKKLGFRVTIPQKATGFRGRETNMPELRWSGIIIALSPGIRKIEYKISVGTLKALMEDPRQTT